MPKAFHGKTGRGFSLIELIVVLLIMLAVSAIAMPRFVTYVSTYRLKASMNQVAGLLQQQRMTAIRLNIPLAVVPTTTNGQDAGYVDVDGDSTWDSTEPGVVLPRSIQVTSAGHPGDATTGLDFTPETGTGVVPRFNARGLPCVIISGACQNYDTSASPAQLVGFVLYFKNSGVFGVPNWGAITVAPTGRIRTWIWNGTTYSGQ